MPIERFVSLLDDVDDDERISIEQRIASKYQLGRVDLGDLLKALGSTTCARPKSQVSSIIESFIEFEVTNPLDNPSFLGSRSNGRSLSLEYPHPLSFLLLQKSFVVRGKNFLSNLA
ncbi:MAG: hypothetical protein M1824_003711 [Vezdaea acicularis]|nr:MAG: hypothetical protein M1824_003711 [Vezdaea acicularis]